MKKMKWLLLAVIVLGLCACSKEDPLLYIAGENASVAVIEEAKNQEAQLPRGTAVFLDEETEDGKYRVYQKDGDTRVYYLLPKENTVEDFNQVVTTKYVTSSILLNLRPERGEEISDAYLKKGENVPVVAVNMERDFNEDGSVDGYIIEKDGKNYYLDAFYTQPESQKKENIYYSTFFDDWYGQGYSKKTYIDDLTYLNVDRSEFSGKPLKKDARAVHVGMSVVYEEQDYLIDLCRESGIDTLVLEIKADDGRLIFESDTARKYLKDPSATEKTCLSKDDFKKVLDRYKAENIYLIGRVVAFKDPVFAAEYPEEAIRYTDGSLYIHDGLAWPSAYSRTAWKYLLSYAKEAVALGIDEIQFDYVRFPDGMSGDEDEGKLDMKNIYHESKPQAIQDFLYYARDELRSVEAYLSADVFGWNMICGDDQNIGQFIPAIACVVDAISPMPYPDHFGEYSLGIAQPWQAPGLLLEAFTEKSMEILNTVESPAIYRTWIQGYPCLEWVCQGTDDNPYRGYGPDEVAEQIQGIRNAGQTGYIVWSGDGGIDMFDWRKRGFIE